MHGRLSLLPWETIDLYSGNVNLSFVDFDLPGNAGFGLRVVRSYNGKDGKWVFGIGPDRIGIWDPMASDANPTITTMDGGMEHAVRVEPGLWITSSYWRLHTDAQPVELETPEGVVYEYGAVDAHETGSVHYLTGIRDAFGNTVTIQRGADFRLDTVTQELGGGQNRVVYFTYDGTGYPSSISSEGRTWTYEFDALGHLLTATPPAGDPWVFTGDRVTTPSGGWVEYVHTMVPLPGGPYPDYTRVVSARHSGGRDIENGTWTIDYHGAQGAWTTVTGPCGVTEYRHGPYVQGTYVLESVEIREGAARLERLDATWHALPAVGAFDPFFERNYPDNTEGWPNPYPLRVASVTTKRNDVVVATREFSYNGGDDFGHPSRVDEERGVRPRHGVHLPA
jgi:hypothetical protein